MATYQIGAQREDVVEVNNDNAIKFLGPESRVLSTPQMILFMERTCRNLILPMIETGEDTVGTHVNVSHTSAAPMGSSVTFFAELLAVNDRRAEFRVVARLGEKIVGEGTHQRAVIQVSRFAEKIKANAG
ncbi:MAG TPA: thioesterase family protein [Bryobacteraceae bacterium]|jgi:fluoroacetyl-CoA thioesterase|nr:thioesterase family protein [Bryobacteraceae bacterium]